jgi:hypothetical protein
MIAATKQAYGFGSDDEARGYIELVYTDPNAANLMAELQKTKIKAGAPAPAAAPAATGGVK